MNSNENHGDTINFYVRKIDQPRWSICQPLPNQIKLLEAFFQALMIYYIFVRVLKLDSRCPMNSVKA
ncbi:hypothetical protein TSAR_010900 [Trichomalopsis sarcophagae]|uniref:Uncharacterized protein n=1 Tax=Trichomalopsis sarcophagae TaxID=543379 RepID=A0A232EYM5_9HYME|nr:hypothetical protein TSAR_010900 [Trichomalopsis sarcophagae]